MPQARSMARTATTHAAARTMTTAACSPTARITATRANDAAPEPRASATSAPNGIHRGRVDAITVAMLAQGPRDRQPGTRSLRPGVRAPPIRATRPARGPGRDPTGGATPLRTASGIRPAGGGAVLLR